MSRDSSQYFVYALVDLRNDTFVYIGITTDLSDMFTPIRILAVDVGIRTQDILLSRAAKR